MNIVSNMTSPRSGEPVKNQFHITLTVDGTTVRVFQSYSTVIALKFTFNGATFVILDERAWDYSVTTSRYRNEFLGENTADTRLKIRDGRYELMNLNESPSTVEAIVRNKKEIHA